MKKLVVIVGPTASGKSELAVRLAKRFHGEIISADSRQVYKGLDIGSGKITKKEMRGIPHHLLSIVSPKRRFTVARYQKLAREKIENIQKRGKLPFLAGGSPLYMYAAIDGLLFPEVPPDRELRKQLEKQSAGELFSSLQALDPKRSETIEQKNKRRLIRALEIVITTGRPVPLLKKQPLPYPVLFFGVQRPQEELKKRIKKRFLSMLKQGFLNEIKDLRKQGLSWKRIEDFGLEYREASQYLQGKLTKQEMIEKAIAATQDLARRQLTWFKKDQRIHWVSSYAEAKRLVEVKLQQS